MTSLRNRLRELGVSSLEKKKGSRESLGPLPVPKEAFEKKRERDFLHGKIVVG